MKKTIFFMSILILCSCSKTLDLSTIDFDNPSNSYSIKELNPYRKENQKGHYEIKEDKDEVSLVLKDNGERVTNYIFMDETTSQINFSELKIDTVLGANVVDYNEKIGFISATIVSKQTPELINYLNKELGKPIEIIYNERSEEMLDLGASKILLQTLPQFTKKQKDDLGNDIINYPQHIIWNKKILFIN